VIAANRSVGNAGRALPGRTYRFGWGTGSRKLAGPALPASHLGRVDAVLLTHDHHADNLDDAGRALLPSAGVVVTTRSAVRRLGGHTRGLAPWQRTTLEAPSRPAIEVTGLCCTGRARPASNLHALRLARAVCRDEWHVRFQGGGSAATRFRYPTVQVDFGCLFIHTLLLRGLSLPVDAA